MKNRWIHCPLCQHRLFFLRVSDRLDMEIKCTSCKSIVRIDDNRTEVIRDGLRKKTQAVS